MAPIVEYLKYGENFEVSVFQQLFHYGSEVNFRQPRERIKILDKYGAVEHIHKLTSHHDVFEMLVDVAGVFNVNDIEGEESISDDMKAALLTAASTPRRLKHQIRIQIRRLLRVPNQIELLPLPRLIKDYLLYQLWED